MNENKGKVGIFWLTPERDSFFHSVSYTLEQGQRYGKWIIASDDHHILWDELEASGQLRGLSQTYRKDYSKLPRARVSYDTEKERFTVYHGNWFTEAHKELILQRYDLEIGQTVFVEDEHYRVSTRKPAHRSQQE